MQINTIADHIIEFAHYIEQHKSDPYFMTSDIHKLSLGNYKGVSQPTHGSPESYERVFRKIRTDPQRRLIVAPVAVSGVKESGWQIISVK
ncbi:MAG: hypothetical protein HN932_12765 [Candidatus Marinimicrobia bacterium]|jgi:hypothetical protein|nr:hypothetical protein [Candidatus Neomarinimicrobiota bacterium]